MCLGLPGKVVRIEGDVAKIDVWGVECTVNIKKVGEPVKIGDYLIAHAGEVVRRIPDEEVYEVLGLYEILLSEAGEDPIAIDACCEMASA